MTDEDQISSCPGLRWKDRRKVDVAVKEKHEGSF